MIGLARLCTLVFWLACVAVPIGAVLMRANGAAAGMLDPLVLLTVRATLWQAAWSTVISVGLGLALGLWVARARGRIRRWTVMVLAIPSGVPTVVAATAWVGLHLSFAYSFAAVIWAHVFFNAPWVALQISEARMQVPRAQLEAAETLGAGAWRRFVAVIWPHLQWTLASASAQVFAFCVMSFALVLILGGGPPVDTLETALYSRVRGGGLDLAGATACAAWEVLITLVPWTLVLLFRRRAPKLEVGRESPGAQAASPKIVAGTAFVLALLFVLPYFAVLKPAQILALFSQPEISAPLLLSFKLALAVGAGTLFIAILAVISLARASGAASFVASILLTLPSGLSVLVLGLGAWLAYGRWVDPFEGSFAAMWALQVTLFFPLAFRMLWPVAQASQKRQLEAAYTLGATPWRAFWLVEWPRYRAPIGSALAVVLAGAIGEVAAVSLFYSESLVPLPMLVTRWMGQYRFEEASAASGVLLLAALMMIGISKGVFRETTS
jgi:thiamine transport system permease protein